MPFLPAFLCAVTIGTADSTVYPILNHERVAGSMIVTRNADTITVRYVFTDRNRGSRDFERFVLRNGRVISTELRRVLADETLGEPTSRVEIVGDSIRRWTPKHTSTEPFDRDTYSLEFISPYDMVLLARQLLHAPSHTIVLGKDSTARLEVLHETPVPTSRGQEPVKLVAVSIGSDSVPTLLWLDAKEDLFATEVGWFMTIKPGAEPALPMMRKIETAHRHETAENLNSRVLKPTPGGIVVTNGDLFDSERGVIVPRQTVVVRGDRIVAVGPAESTPVPEGATVIDATGKTIMPGMWDMHGHLQHESEDGGSPVQLSFGITTVRDLASDVDVATAHRARADAGTIASPRDVLAGFIEGTTKWAGPTSVLVSTEAEARAWVSKYDSLGYKQVKLYNVVHPDLVPTIIAEAHKRGMRVSGHIPRGLSVQAAVQLGFDEVQHAAFFFSTFYQDSLYVPTMRAYSQVATAVAPNVNVDGAPMTQLIEVLKQHNSVVDGTWAVWVESAGTGTAQAVGAGVTADAAKADANYIRLLKRMYDAGITLVPGTDDYYSSSYDTELELYERAGLPAPAVLQSATIVSARVMRDDKDYGSVSTGKIADLFIVSGRPAEHVKDIRNVEQVIRAGRLYDSAALRTATGFHPQ